MVDLATSSASAAGMRVPGMPALQAGNAALATRRLDDTAAMLNGLDVGAENTLTKEQLEKIDTAAKDFEAVFLSEMMKPMFESVEVDSEFGGGRGEEMFRGMVTQEYGKIFAQRGGIGLAAQVREQMIKMQTGQNNGAAESVVAMPQQMKATPAEATSILSTANSAQDAANLSNMERFDDVY
jgi:Rod binding domain-containing protein